MSWTAHYVDRRMNGDAISRAHATKEGALRNACDLTKQNCIVKYLQGPDNERIGPVEITAWCKAHPTADRPIDPKAPSAKSESRPEMATHKFKLRQTVFLQPTIFNRDFAGGAYEVTKQLPERRGQFEYRIKSSREPHERVVRESELNSE
jgi:hypothetical protein